MSQHPDIIVSVDLGTTFTGNCFQPFHQLYVSKQFRCWMEVAADANPGNQ